MDNDSEQDDGPELELRRLCLQLEQNDPALTSLDTDPFYGYDFATRLGQSLMGNTPLNEITLRFLELNEQEARALGAGIGQLARLEILEINGEVREKLEGPGNIKQILFEGIGASQTLQEISITSTHGDSLDGFAPLFATAALKTLKISHVGSWNLDFGQNLFSLLTRSSTLTSLEIDNVRLGDEGFASIGRGLAHNVSLIILILDGCEIGDASIQLFIENWHPASPLKLLHLPVNSIGPLGAQQLLRAAANHPPLQDLDLSWNQAIGFEGLKKIGEELPTQLHLTQLNIASCVEYIQYADECCEKARAQAKAWLPARQALINGMERNTHIAYVDVTQHPSVGQFPLEFTAQVDFFGRLNQMGRHLLSTDTAPTVWCRLLATCQRHEQLSTSFTYFFLREQPTLVQTRDF